MHFCSCCVQTLRPSTRPHHSAAAMSKRLRDDDEEEAEEGHSRGPPSWRSRVVSEKAKVLEAIQAREAVLGAKAESLRKSREALEEEVSKARQDHGASEPLSLDSWVKLNVGGTRVAYRRSAFLLPPSSFLAATFSGACDKRLPEDKEGRVFIDENPFLFEAAMSALLAAKVRPPACGTLITDRCLDGCHLFRSSFILGLMLADAL